VADGRGPLDPVLGTVRDHVSECPGSPGSSPFRAERKCVGTSTVFPFDAEPSGTLSTMTVKMLKNKSHRTYVSRAHAPPHHTSHPRIAHRTHLPLIARIPRFSLGEVFCPGPDRAGSRGSATSFFTLFRGSLELVSSGFCLSRAAGLSEVRDPITSIGFRLRPKACQRGNPLVPARGHNHQPPKYPAKLGPVTARSMYIFDTA